jgi:virginiamycin B lyase
LWFTNAGNNSIGRITTAGAVTSYTGPGISGPQGVASGPDGALWFANAGNNSIGRITTAGAVTNYTGTGINLPYGIASGPDGALWFANNGNNSIGRITTAGTVTNYTGPGMGHPQGIASGPDGALWFTDYGNSIGRITTTVTPTVSGVTPRSGVAGTAVTITGQNLSGATKVLFNGTPATIVSDSATKVVTKVPAGATNGHVSVSTPVGTATSVAIVTVT